MDEKIKIALQDYVATFNSGKYKTLEELDSKFPELVSFDKNILKDYITTANSEKYSDWDDLNSKFPELFPKSSEVSGQDSKNTSETSVESLESSQPIREKHVDTLMYDGVGSDPENLELDTQLYEEGKRRIIVDVPVKGLGDNNLSRKGEFIIPEEAVQGTPELIEIEGKGYVVKYQDAEGKEQYSEEFVKPVKEEATGFWSNVGNSIAQFPDIFNQAVYSIPELVYNIGATPQNALADATGQDWLRADFRSATEDTPLNIINQVVDHAKSSQAYYNSQIKYSEDSIVDAINSGNLTEAGSRVAEGIIKSIPNMVAMYMTGGVGRAASLGTISRTSLNALPFASSKFQEINDRKDISQNTKILTSLLNGYAEVIFSQSFGTGKLIDDIATGAINKKQASDMIKGYLEKVLASNSIPSVMLKGGVEEGATTLSQNIIDKYTIDPNKDLMEGVMDAVIIGGLADASLRGGSKISDNLISKASKSKVQTIESEIEGLQADLDNPNLSESAKDMVQQEIESKVAEINSTVESETTSRQNMDVDTRERVDKINEDIQAIDNSINPTQEGVEPVSEQTAKLLNDQKTELQKELDSILKENEAKPNVQDTQVSTESIDLQETVTPQDITEIESVSIPTELGGKESFSKVVFNNEARSSRIQELEARLKINSQNLGISQDPMQDAKWMRDATEYAVLKIADGTVKSVKALSEILGLDVKNENLVKVYNDATKIREDLKQFEVPASKQSIKKTIKDSTSGGITGEVTMTSKEALKQRFRTLNEGAKLGKKNIESLRTEVTTALKELKDQGAFKGEVKARALGKIGNLINKANTPAQVKRATDAIEKVGEDIKFAQKLNELASTQKKLLRMSKASSTPKDLSNTVKSFARISPIDLDITDLETYLENANELLGRGEKIATVTTEQLQRLVDISQANREDRANQRELNKQPESLEEEAKRLEKLRDQAINKEAKKEEKRKVAEEYKKATEKLDLKRVENPTERELVREAIEDNLLDPTNLPDNLIDEYISVLYNLNANGSAVGLGNIITAVKANNKLSDSDATSYVTNALVNPNSIIKGLKQIGAASGSQQFDAIVRSRDNVGKVHEYFGLTDVQIQSVKTFTEIANIKEGFNKIVKKYRSDLENNPKANVRLAVYSDLMQYRKGWEAKDISKEVGLRLEAWYKSLERMEDVNNSDYQKDNKESIKNLREVLTEISEVKEIDGKSQYSLKNINESQLFKSLPNGYQEMYKYMRQSYSKIQEKFFAVSRVYGGLDVETDWQNYLPRTYQDLKSSDVRAIERQLASGTKNIKDVEVLQAGFNSSINSETTQSGQSRLISGNKLPLNKVLNTDIIGTFLSEIGKVHYDTNTMAERKFTTSMLDIERNGLKFDDTVPLDIYKSLVAQKIYGDKIQLGVPDLNPHIIERLFNTFGKLGVAKALGGVSQFLKQTPPLIEVMGRVSNPTIITQAISVLHRGDAKNILAMGDVALRSLDNEISAPRGSNLMSPADRNSLERTFRRLGMKIEDISNVMADISLMPLKSTDTLMANAGWLSFYIDYNKKNNGGVVDFTKPNKEAIAYANTQNSIVMNESDASLQASLPKKPFMRFMYPFSSFAINAKVTVINSISRLNRERNPTARRRLIGEISGNIANIALFNYISWQLRDIAIQTIGWAMGEFLGSVDLPEDEREELKKELEKDSDNRQALNDMRSLGYLAQDFMFGGLFGKFMEPAFTPVTDAITESVFGKDEMIVRGYGGSKAFGEKPLEDALGLLGAQGIYAKNALDLYKNVKPLLESPEDYVKKTRGEVNAERDAIIVDSYYLDPSNIENFDREEYDKATKTANITFSGLAMFGFSDQTLNSSARYATNYANTLLKKKGVKERTTSDQDMIDSARKITSIKFSDALDIPLDYTQKLWYLSQWPVEVDKAKKMMGTTKTLGETEYEKRATEIATQNMNYNFYLKFKNEFNENTQKTIKKLVKEGEDVLKKVNYYKNK